MKFILIVAMYLLSVNETVHSASSEAGLFYRYAIMFSGKSTQILEKVSEKGRKNVCLITASITQRAGQVPAIRARGHEQELVDVAFESATDFIKLFKVFLKEKKEVYIDECQFLTEPQIVQISDFYKVNPEIAVYFYGLLYDCFGMKFPASELLEKIANKAEPLESKAVCACCEEPALYNVRINKASYCVETIGEQVATTAQGYSYISVCDKHKDGDLSEFFRQINESCAK